MAEMFSLAVLLLPLIAISFFLLACIANETFWGSFLLSGILLVYLGWWQGFSVVFGWIWANPALLMGYITIYFILGVLSSFFLWDRFCSRQAKVWKDRTKSDPNKKDVYIPVWCNNKAKLTAWTVWWPFSMANYILGRLVIDALEWIQAQFGNVYKRLAERHFKEESTKST